MNVSLRETGCLKKTLNILFSSCLCIMHIKPPGVEASTCGLSYFLYECENNYTYSVSCDRTDKNKV